MVDTSNSTTTNQSTIAAFAIIEEMAKHSEDLRLTDLAASLGMPRARVYRYLQTLAALGYVRQDPASERYRLTLKLFHIGQAVADGTQLTSAARPLMQSLCEAVAQTVTLAIPEETGMRVLDIFRVDTLVQIVTKPGAVLPLHNSAQGKLALAFGPASYLERIEAGLAQGDPALARIDETRLRQEIATVRGQGWATAPEEILRGVNAVAAPIFDINGRFTATLSVVGSVEEIKPDPAEHYVAAVKNAARQVSAELGCMEYPV